MILQTHGADVDRLPDALAGTMDLLPGLLLESKAQSTSNSYFRGFLKWKQWAYSNGLGSEDILPARALHVGLYLASLIQSANSPSTVINAFYSLRWVHAFGDFVSPTDSPLVKNILEAGKRKLAKPINKKLPITTEIIEKIYDRNFEEANVYKLRTICAILVGYAGFLRSQELLAIRRCDIYFEPCYMSIFIEKSKTDIYRDGSWVIIAKTGNKLCPVVNMLKYIGLLDFDSEYSEGRLFCNLSACKGGHRFRSDRKSISYTTLRDLFKAVLMPHVSDVSKYGLHSLRSGGATKAANMGIPDRLFKRHGRWRSEKAKDGYVKDSLDSRLAVSQSLGL